MSTCSICYERFVSPVSLPCGHLFCRECVRRTVESSLKSLGPEHVCPTCRAPYSILTLDPALVPPYLRPHILPPIRPVFFDDRTPATTPASASTSASTSSSAARPPKPSLSPTLSTMPSPTAAPTAAPASLAHLTTMPPLPTPAELASSSALTSSSASFAAAADAELPALRLACATWRRRAETHAAANASLLSFARAARDCALRMRAERDEERKRWVGLKRKIKERERGEAGSDSDNSSHTSTSNKSTTARAPPPPPPPTGLPVFLMCNPPPVEPYPLCFPSASGNTQQESRLGPPLKRRKACGVAAAQPQPVFKVEPKEGGKEQERERYPRAPRLSFVDIVG
ncbi:hypothetical protein B0H11DRAFT_2282299 [Mycena galericulata]|nr:hypothetical protein B0H11DRAFT_2282299 [Mycena galericulata]